MSREPVRVVAAALVRQCADGAAQLLIAQRPPGKWQAGRWEFPGGKIEPGESAAAAAHRELAEELGVRILQLVAVGSFRHDYPDRCVEIMLWLVTRYEGVPRGLDGQALHWASPAELASCNLLEADQPMIEPLLAALSGVTLGP